MGTQTAQAQLENSRFTPFGFKVPAHKFDLDSNSDPFDYKGEPVAVGGFEVLPNITIQQEYNDNIFATEENTQSDFITVIKPSIAVHKKYRRHQFLATADVEMRRYWDIPDENVENYKLGVSANLEAKQNINIPLSLTYEDKNLARQAQSRRSVADLTKEPLTVKSIEAEAGIIYKPNRFSLALIGQYKETDFKDGVLRNGNIIDRDQGDVEVLSSTIRASYDMRTNWTPYFEATFSNEDYTNESVNTAASRDNSLFRLLAGTSFNYKGIVYGFLGWGVDNRRYRSEQVSDATALSLDSKISWELSPKSKFTFEISRETKEDNVIIAGLTQTASGLEYQHELRENTFLRLMGIYNVEDFDDSLRADTTIETGLGIHHIISPRLQIGTDYQYVTRDSTISGLNMDNNILMLRAHTAW